MTKFCRGLIAGLGVAWLAAGAWGHEIPNHVSAHLIAKPAGDRLQLLVRVPLSSMRDVEFPALPNGYLDIDELAPRLEDLATQWIAASVKIWQGDDLLSQGRVVRTQISLPSDRSFASFDRAWARLNQPLPASSENLLAEQVFFDSFLEYPTRGGQGSFSMRPGLEHLGTQVVTVLQFHTTGGAVRAYQFTGDPGRTPLDPSWSQAAWRFVGLGFVHILEGPDHLLFLFCLVIPFRRFRSLALIVTAFTIAHSITLIGSALDLAPRALWFPALVEVLIAASIVYMALENIAGPATQRRRWIFAFAFGLIHGFGFSFALRETLQLAGEHLLTSLVSFNLGVELGQLLVLLALIPALEGLFRFVVAERMGTIILSAIVAHTSWHWMTERAGTLSQYEFTWTGWTAADMALAMRWLMWILLAGGALWMASAWRRRQPVGADLPAGLPSND